MERRFIISESMLHYLLVCQMESEMNRRDGVDNWEWHGESRKDIIEDYCPDYDEENDCDLTFDEVARLRIDNGEFIEESLVVLNALDF